MTLTVILDDKSKQVIKLSKFFSEGRTYGEQYLVAKQISCDISKSRYPNFELHE